MVDGTLRFSALTIAGVDSCGCAGIAADLKTFSALKVHGASVVTALTAQNTVHVIEVIPVAPSFVETQLRAVMEDLSVEAAKTGMLHSAETVNIAADLVEHYGLKIVVDPVLYAATGRSLASEDAVKAYRRRLLPVAMLVTPNLIEAGKLAGFKVSSLTEMRKAAEVLADIGVKGIVMKGGHRKGSREVTDLLYFDGEFTTYTKPRLPYTLHGGGCSFSAAITAYLAHRLKIPEAIEKAEAFIQSLFEYPLKIGRGNLTTNPLRILYNEAERLPVLEDVAVALKALQKTPALLPYIAEVGTQIAESLPCPSTPQHIAAVEGRIRPVGGRLKAGSKVRFGASSHMARVVLACHQLEPSIRAAVNLHYDKKLIQAFKETGLIVASFNRSREPRRAKMTEGATLQWGIKQTTSKAGRMPDVIYDLGETGKEPMIRVVGQSALEVVNKIQMALRCMKLRSRLQSTAQ